MKNKPNIILIFPDQWRYDALSYLGHGIVETPYLDQIAANGVVFENAYSPAPTCIATRASLATGLTPYNCGRIGYRDFVEWRYKNTFMMSLRDAGYQTMCVGKTHFYPARARLGFEELELYETEWQEKGNPSDYHRFLLRETGGRVKDTATLFDSNSSVAVPWTAEEYLHPNCWTFNRAVSFLERRDPQRPFFIQISPHRPHPPLDPPLEWMKRYSAKKLPPVPIGDWAEGNDAFVRGVCDQSGKFYAKGVLDDARYAYYAQIAHLDQQIGMLCRFLKGSGLLADTWIIFMSDHGEMLGDHYMFRKTAPFEGSAHVPLIIQPPPGTGLAGVGSRCPAPVAAYDIAPTVLEIAGVRFAGKQDGHSLCQFMTAPEAAPSFREFIHIEHSPCWQAVTNGRRKFIYNMSSGKRWYFNLEEDPEETRNLAGIPEFDQEVEFWENRLIGVLAPRGKGFTQNGRLASGFSFEAIVS